MTIAGVILLCIASTIVIAAAFVRMRARDSWSEYALCVIAGILFSVVTSYERAAWLSAVMGALGTLIAIVAMHGLAAAMNQLRRVRPPSE